MEETLRQLQEAMQAHRRIMAGADPSGSDGDIAALPSLAHDVRGVAVQLLVRDIERVCGIDISGMMEAKLGRVLASVSLPALQAWVDRLHRLPPDDAEWLSLVESLTVHETFFHRDRSQLDLLRRRLLPEVIAGAARDGSRRLRFWSAGCATGEEAYTLAIVGLLALRDAGFARDEADGGIGCLPPWTIEVLGSDISRQVLARAAAATYPTEELGAFRSLPDDLNPFFPAVRCEDAGPVESRGVHHRVRSHVRFGWFNLMAETPPVDGCDIVLCRNVLIYLTPTARARAQSVLQRALRPGGYLMLGPTDALTEERRCDACWGEGAVAYRLKQHDG
ncbi:MAG TPA: CheR family methyltransferase [Stellaceae bacterium]|jgi:chemotaxis protein methyltransferase CheR